MADEKKTVDGRIAKPPEFKEGREGKKDFAKFSLVVDNEDGTPTWYNVTAFSGLGKLVRDNLKKGMEVRVKGRVSVREYTRNDGSTGSSNDLIADEFVLEGGVKLDKFTSPSEQKPLPNGEAKVEAPDEDAPF